MIEPTESEAKAELDRFCDAMIAIRREIAAIGGGPRRSADNPLKNAPHTMDDIADAEWDRGYSRAEAVFPAEELRSAKYWPPVNRIDQVHGDRNLICACPAAGELPGGGGVEGRAAPPSLRISGVDRSGSLAPAATRN